MSQVMAVAFEPNGQLHYLDPAGETYRVGDWVLHPTSDGPEVCRVVWAPEEAEAPDALPVCAGHASPADLERDDRNRARRENALQVSRELIAKHGLDMKVVGVDVLDRAASRRRGGGITIAVYYTAPFRVDFRALIPDLARALHASVDLRQVGSRDAARLTGGIGRCGRELCCSTFLTDFEPVAQRLPREQGTNPLQVAGECGRLLCCLKYEQPLYTDFARRAPGIGAVVSTPEGEGVVVGHDAPADAVRVRSAEGEVTRCPLIDVCLTAGRRKQRQAVLEKTRRRGARSAHPGEDQIR